MVWLKQDVISWVWYLKNKTLSAEKKKNQWLLNKIVLKQNAALFSYFGQTVLIYSKIEGKWAESHVAAVCHSFANYLVNLYNFQNTKLIYKGLFTIQSRARLASALCRFTFIASLFSGLETGTLGLGGSQSHKYLLSTNCMTNVYSWLLLCCH